jgi:hypothetical protein
MRMHKIRWFGYTVTTILSLVLLVGCGDDDTESGEDEPKAGSGGSETDGGGGKETSGTGGTSEAQETGGTTETAIDSGTGDGSEPFQMPTANCSEEAPTEPVVCGGVTCEIEDPTGGMMGMFGGSCLFPCCAEKDGADVCGAKDTTVDYEVSCQPPPEPDTRCPDYNPTQTTEAPDGSTTDAGFATGMETMAGCCTPEGLCGVISSIRPLCITKSQYIDLPDPPQPCE